MCFVHQRIIFQGKKGQHFEEMKKGQNVDLFTLEYDSLMHKTHFIVRGLKNALSIITN